MADRDDAIPAVEWRALVATAEREIEAILARLEVATRRPVRWVWVRAGRKGGDPQRFVVIELVDKEIVAVEYGWRGP